MIFSKAVTESKYKELLQKEIVITNKAKQQSWNEAVSPRVVIVDCGAVSNIDTMGVEAVMQVHIIRWIFINIIYFMWIMLFYDW